MQATFKEVCAIRCSKTKDIWNDFKLIVNASRIPLMPLTIKWLLWHKILSLFWYVLVKQLIIIKKIIMDWFYLSLSLSIKTVARKTRELNMVSLVCSSCRVCMASHASERELTKKEIVETALRGIWKYSRIIVYIVIINMILLNIE